MLHKLSNFFQQYILPTKKNLICIFFYFALSLGNKLSIYKRFLLNYFLKCDLSIQKGKKPQLYFGTQWAKIVEKGLITIIIIVYYISFILIFFFIKVNYLNILREKTLSLFFMNFLILILKKNLRMKLKFTG